MKSSNSLWDLQEESRFSNLKETSAIHICDRLWLETVFVCLESDLSGM